MRRWFLSYHSPDEDLAERVKIAIEQRDAGSRVFFAPKNLRAGGFWSQQLAAEIAEATVFVLLVGEHGVGPWQVLEYDEALDKRVTSADFPVVLLLREGGPAPGLPFLRRLHWIVTADPASEQSIGRLLDAASGNGSTPGELWRHTSPYRGLEAMAEKDSDYFFGREHETVEVLEALASAPDRLPTLLGNSGVGKSSLARAGVLAALKRQAWPEGAAASGAWPAAFHASRRWCFLTLRPGTEPVGSLVEAFLETWRLDSTSTDWPKRRAEWIDGLLSGKLGLRDLLDQTKRRYAELQQSEPPAFLVYIDQGEELYVRAEEGQRRCFSQLVAQTLADPRLYALMSLRADFFGELQRDEPLYKSHRLISVPPLREAELREVVSRPAALLSARFENDHFARDIASRTADESTRDAGALPLLSYLLDDMWRHMIDRGDGILRLPAQSIDLGRVLVDRANAFIASHRNSEETLRRVFTLKLATVREDGEPARRRARRAEFSGEEWQLVSALADHPYRLLVTAAVETGRAATQARPVAKERSAEPTASETYAEVAHEAIFRRWDRLREWIAAEREFLIWRSGVEAARRAWKAAPDVFEREVSSWRRSRRAADALLVGLPLAQAQSWLAKRAQDIPAADREFIVLSRTVARRQRLRVHALVAVLALAIVGGLIGWLNEPYLIERWRWFSTIRPYMMTQFRPYVLTTDAEGALRPMGSFRECAVDCPEMVVVPAGEFIMGSPVEEKGRNNNEGPQYKVVFAKPFAISKYEVTFDEWDVCVAYGDCDPRVSDNGLGHGRQPVINVTWDDAQHYVAWLSRMTGQRYRLLSEAEWEYAARAGTTTPFSFGSDEEALGQHAWYRANSRSRPHPVGEKAPSVFGLYDMHGNVWEWVEDCYRNDHKEAPKDGSAWVPSTWSAMYCAHRVVRGGSWTNNPQELRSAIRSASRSDGRSGSLGFRVGRTLMR